MENLREDVPYAGTYYDNILVLVAWKLFNQVIISSQARFLLVSITVQIYKDLDATYT